MFSSGSAWHTSRFTRALKAPEAFPIVAQRTRYSASVSRGALRTRRWCDPADPDDGLRILVCRYRPRGVLKQDETWDTWLPALGPSRELHAAFYGKRGAPIRWAEYRRRYLAEMKTQTEAIAAITARLERGESVSLLCSSACTDAERCHRTLLATLIAQGL